MNVNEILAHIDDDLSRLRQARALLAGQGYSASRTGRRRRKRTISAEGRARIAAAQRKRWATQKRAGK